MKSLIASLCLAFVFATAAIAKQQQWQAVGQGDMRWTFFKLYRITLLSEDGLFKQAQYPKALEIQYYRDISAEQLVDATRKQMRHINFEHPDSDNWFEQLTKLWPDVKSGDTLRFEVDKDLNNRFLYNEQPIGGIDSPEFSEGFISIWLSPKTSEPDLRKQLINK